MVKKYNSFHILDQVGLQLIDQLDIGILIESIERKAYGNTYYYANHTAQRLLQLPFESPTLEQIKAIPFTIDVELTASLVEREPSQHPLLALFQHSGIEKRYFCVHGEPISLQSKTVFLTTLQCNIILLFRRDHRLSDLAAHQPTSSNEYALKEYTSFGRMISQLSTNILNTKPDKVNDAIQHVLVSLGKFLNVDRTYIFEFTSGAHSMSNTFEWVRDGLTSHIDELQNIPLSNFPWLAETIKQEGFFIVNDVSKIPPEGKLERIEYEKESIQSLLCIGLYVQEQLVAMIGCDMVHSKKNWSELDIRRVKIIGEMLTSALQKQYFMSEVHTLHSKLLRSYKDIQRLSELDSLTKLMNRNRFNSQLPREFQLARRHQTPLCLVMLNISNFSQYNRTYGYNFGDTVLKHIADCILQSFLYPGEHACRYNGDEFALLLPNTTVDIARKRAHHLLQLLHQQLTQNSEAPGTSELSFYIGVSLYENIHLSTEDMLVNSAREALEHARQQDEKIHINISNHFD